MNLIKTERHLGHLKGPTLDHVSSADSLLSCSTLSTDSNSEDGVPTEVIWAKSARHCWVVLFEALDYTKRAKQFGDQLNGYTHHQLNGYTRPQPNGYARPQPYGYTRRQPNGYTRRQPNRCTRPQPNGYTHRQPNGCIHTGMCMISEVAPRV